MPVSRHTQYLWSQPEWPVFTFQQEALVEPIGRARRAQGISLGIAQAIGLARRADILHEIWVGEALATAAIEGEKLNLEHVRSSVLRKMGITRRGGSSRTVDGLVEVMDNAMRDFAGPLTHARLCRWQAALFPAGRSGLARIETGKYRTHPDPMQIVSGRPGKERVHYVAPPSSRMREEMSVFLAWFRDSQPGGAVLIDGIARAAIAHLWFESIHPFEDGNGRIGRAICDLALAQDSGSSARLFTLSQQLHGNRTQYYERLNMAQRGSTEVTEWVVWFIRQFEQACAKSTELFQAALNKAHFWETAPPMNERQAKAVQKLLDAGPGGFEGGMSAAKYANLTTASKATATRDLADLADKGVLVITGQGRGTRYWLRHFAGQS